MAKKKNAKPKDGEGEEEKGGSKKKLIIIGAVLLAGGGYFFFGRGGGEQAPAALPPPMPGPVIKLDPITINLAGGHFLKLGLALQSIAGAHEEPDGSKALDLAITQFSGMTIEELSTTDGRERAKDDLLEEVKAAYMPHVEGAAGHESASGSGESDHESDNESDNSQSDEDAGDSQEGHGTDQSEESSEESDSSESEGSHGTEGGAEEAHPDVYDIYFTEFVMQ
jgi:flagellar FliL protein